jgi:hypothetical protein
MTWHAPATLASRNAEGAPLRTIAFAPDPPEGQRLHRRRRSGPPAPTTDECSATHAIARRTGPASLSGRASRTTGRRPRLARQASLAKRPKREGEPSFERRHQVLGYRREQGAHPAGQDPSSA